MRFPRHLTIAYITNRREPCWAWFFDSLHRELRGDYQGIKILVIDFFQKERAGILPEWVVHIPPKPTVWQGEYRLTTQDYFAASNARNTAICHAPDGWIAFVDDLSVLLPGWADAITHAMRGRYIVCGAYRKVNKLVVERGEIVSYEDHKIGHDSRWSWGQDDRAVSCGGASMFGCSLAAPVEAFLSVNGFDEDCDSMGSEDYICGMMMQRQHYQFRYDRRMLTWESEERHHLEKPLMRIIKKTPRPDASHAILNMVHKGGRWVAPNYFGPGGIAEIRRTILAGGAFPTIGIPEHDWRDGQPLREM